MPAKWKVSKHNAANSSKRPHHCADDFDSDEILPRLMGWRDGLSLKDPAVMVVKTANCAVHVVIPKHLNSKWCLNSTERPRASQFVMQVLCLIVSCQKGEIGITPKNHRGYWLKLMSRLF